MPDYSSIGDPTPSLPIPMRLRNPNIPKRQGGSLGYRGPGYAKIRNRILYLARGRSTATGLDETKATLEIDHIGGYRYGFSSLHNTTLTLRVLDQQHNKALDPFDRPGPRRMRPRMRTF